MTNSIADTATALQALVDVLLPGDDVFPPASTVGAHNALAERMRDSRSADDIDKLIDALALDGKAFVNLTGRQRIQAVQRLEQRDPDLFGFVRTATYFGYYESPIVVRAIRQLGHDYNDAPQPRGYTMQPFDPKIDAPRKPRGFYKKTDEIERIEFDLSERP